MISESILLWAILFERRGGGYANRNSCSAGDCAPAAVQGLPKGHFRRPTIRTCRSCIRQVLAGKGLSLEFLDVTDIPSSLFRGCEQSTLSKEEDHASLSQQTANEFDR